MDKYSLIITKSDSRANVEYPDYPSVMSAYHSELASDYLYFAEGTIDFFTVMVTNLSGDIIVKEFQCKQEGA